MKYECILWCWMEQAGSCSPETWNLVKQVLRTTWKRNIYSCSVHECNWEKAFVKWQTLRKIHIGKYLKAVRKSLWKEKRIHKIPIVGRAVTLASITVSPGVWDVIFGRWAGQVKQELISFITEFMFKKDYSNFFVEKRPKMDKKS